jgi:phytoene synthase
VVATGLSLDAAYAYCQRLASAHYENFPVASLLLPRYMRPHIAAVYAFARVADDIADEGEATAEDRLAGLDAWRRRLRAAAVGQPGRDDGPHPQVFLALSHTMKERHLPVALFEDLLSAFGQDVTTTRYATWAELLDYCRRSANPVGRLVLRVAGHEDDALDRSSDALCTALQLTNFWQDLAADWARGRLYVPVEDAGSCGARVDDFDPNALTAEWRATLARVVARTHTLFDEGRAVCDGVDGRLRFELRLTWLGGRAILDRATVECRKPNPSRPSLGVTDVPALLWRASTWQSAS